MQILFEPVAAEMRITEGVNTMLASVDFPDVVNDNFVVRSANATELSKATSQHAAVIGLVGPQMNTDERRKALGENQRTHLSSPGSNMRCHRFGMTLLELLAVFVCIVILLALLIPALARCTTNLRTLDS